jgi:hypothetical protein
MDVVTDMQQYARERWQLRQKRFKPVVMRSNDTLSDSDSLNEDSVSPSILTEEA